ncbi:MAG: ADOP family duplicated permease, partial [Terriglobales bacterium]
MNDLRYALRQIARSPGYAAVSILTLALGLAATAAIFSVVHGVLLQPLAYRNPSHLVALELRVPKLAQKFPAMPINPAIYLAWARSAKTLSGISLIDEGEKANLTGPGGATLLDVDKVTANLFDVLGVRPQLGRTFAGGDRNDVILTNALWRSRFGANPDVIGQTVALDGVPHAVIGVLPASFHFPTQGELVSIASVDARAGLFVPLQFTPGMLQKDGAFGFASIARLRPGVSPAAASADLNAILRRQFDFALSTHATTEMVPLGDMIVHAWRTGLWMLLAAVLAVLLLIAVNLANLALARALARQQETAIRSALGASRGRLLRQALLESLLLGLAGGVLGLGLAEGALQALLALVPAGMPRAMNVRLDWTVVGFTLTLSLLAGLLAGLIPAWRVARGNAQEALRAGGAHGGGRLRARALLVGGGTALSAILLVAAGMLLASFSRLAQAPTGFRVDHILTATLQLPQTGYTNAGQARRFWDQALVAAGKIPGVRSAAFTNWLPLGGEMNDDPVVAVGDHRPATDQPWASYRRVSPGFFTTFGLRLLEGRTLTSADVGTDAVVISRATARAVWPGQDPIGRCFDASEDFAGFRVVGVVGDVSAISLRRGPGAVVYQPFHGSSWGALVLRTGLPAATVAPALRRALGGIDPSVAVPPLRSMNQIVAASVAPQRFQALLTSLFAAAALLLACLGMYGVVSYAVEQRWREAATRLALGAPRGAVVRLMMRQGGTPAALGLAAGLAGALALMRLLASLLY